MNPDRFRLPEATEIHSLRPDQESKGPVMECTRCGDTGWVDGGGQYGCLGGYCDCDAGGALHADDNRVDRWPSDVTLDDIIAADLKAAFDE